VITSYRAKDKSQQELLLSSFYQYTTLSHKAAYEWADPLVHPTPILGED
jgi:hypothetical protein